MTRANETSFDKWSTDFSLAPDDVIRRLGARDERNSTKTDTSVTSQRYANDETDYETDFTDDSDTDDEEAADDAAAAAAEDCTPETSTDETAVLERLLEANPEIYKRCKLNIKLANLAHAVVCNDNSQIIVIKGRHTFGHALHGDEVVVRIDTEENGHTFADDVDACDHEDVESLAESAAEDTADITFGKVGEVVGILKRTFNPINRAFICRRDYNNRRNMIPLDIRLPIVRIKFCCEKHRTSQQTDTVCVSVEKPRWKHFKISSTSQLFRVKLEKWDKQQFNPLGCVVGLVKNAVEEQIDLLEERNGVQKSFSKDAVEQAAQTTDKLHHNVEDYRGQIVFSIDEPNATALDDAVSVEQLGDGYKFGIHIADVSARVPRDSPVDKDAKERCLMFRPVARKPSPMLPAELGAGICSLLQGKDRPTVSVFVTTDSDYSVRQEDVVIKRCQVRSRHQLTYAEAEELIAQEATDSDVTDDHRELVWSIRRLKEAAISWRTERLGSGKCYRRPKIMSMDSVTARTLVQEMMIMANSQVARKLVDNVPCENPLRRKLPQEHSDNGFVHFNVEDGCSEAEASEYVHLSRSMCIALQNAARSNSAELMKCLVTNIEHQPQLAVESVKQQNARAEYICSGNEPRRNWQHCSLKLPQYAHFTSPIRRYIDIVVHRILLSLIDINAENRYTKDDIAEICRECNDAGERAHHVKYDSCRIRLSSLLTERSVVVFAVVHAVTESDIVLLFPNLQPMFSADSAVKISSLKPSTLPDMKLDTVRVRWKQRIYDLSHHQSTETPSTSCRVVELDQQQYLVRMNTSDWQELLQAVTVDDGDAVSEAISELLRLNDGSTDSAVDLTSEGEILRSGEHYCEYAATFSSSFVVKVQIAAKASYSHPHIQLFHLSRKMCICVEHNTNVVESFSKPAMAKAAVRRYLDIGHYQKLWLPVLSVEAAYSAVTSGDSVIIHNVDIHWKKLQV